MTSSSPSSSIAADILAYPDTTQTLIENVHSQSQSRKVRAHGRVRDHDPVCELVRQRPPLRGLGRKPFEPGPLDRLCRRLRRVSPSEGEKDLPAVCRRGTRSREVCGARRGRNTQGGLGGQVEKRGQDAGWRPRVGCGGWAEGIVARGIETVGLARRLSWGVQGW